jgi:hypothetical protein
MSLRERTRRVGIVGPLIVALEPGNLRCPQFTWTYI